MTARELVSTLQARGVRLRAKGDRIAYEAPPAILTPIHRRALQDLKPEILEILRTEGLGGDWTRISLRELDRVLEIAVPWSDIRLLISPGCRLARELRAADQNPGRVWCVCELADLLLSGIAKDDACEIAQTRLTFDAVLTGIWKARQ